MEKTFKIEELELVRDILNDAKAAREGKITSYMLAEDNAKRIRIFTVGPEHNCCITIGDTDVATPTSEFFTFLPEDIENGARNSSGHVVLTVSTKTCNMKFRSNKRETYRATEIGDDAFKSRLNIFNKQRGPKLFSIKPNELYKLFNAMTVGSSADSTKTTFTRFRLLDANKLQFYKYSTESSAIFGSIEIEDGNITHPKLAGKEKGCFHISEAFPNMVRTIMKLALKDEGGRMIDFYYNGSAIAIQYTTDQHIIIQSVYNGAGNDEENIAMIDRISAKFTTQFGSMIFNTSELSSVLKDAEATTSGSSCFIKVKKDIAEIFSASMIGKTPLYSNVISEVQSNLDEKFATEHPDFQLPVITDSFLGLLETYEKFDIEENNQITVNLYQLVTKVADKKAEAFMIEISTSNFTGRLVVRIC